MRRRVIRARYRLATPAFIQGASGSSPELRPPSFKGILRFWWRALAWSRLGGDQAAIRAAESQLFGDTSGQAGVRLRIERDDVRPRMMTNGGGKIPPGTLYLAGQGLAHFKNGWQRQALESGQCFTVVLGARDGVADLGELTDSLRLIGLMGGLGSRSRKGFGSLVLEEVELDGQKQTVPPTGAATVEALGVLASQGALSTELPEYTALSARSRFLVLEGSKKASDALEVLGADFLRFRSYGRNGKDSTGGQAEQNFKGDHDLAVSVAVEGKSATRAPERAVLGLPHNYFSTNKWGLEVGPASSGLERRASPLFFHFIDGGPKAVCVVGFLPARFLPEGEEIELKPKPKRGSSSRVPVTPDPKLWEPIHRYFERLKSSKVALDVVGEVSA